MLTYDEIKDLCKHAGEVSAICPVNCKRCTAENCPITDKFTQSKDYNQKMCDLKQEENELEAEQNSFSLVSILCMWVLIWKIFVLPFFCPLMNFINNDMGDSL